MGIVVDIKEAEAKLTKQINNLEQQIKTLIEVSPTENGVKLPDFENYTTYGDIEVYNMMPPPIPLLAIMKWICEKDQECPGITSILR